MMAVQSRIAEVVRVALGQVDLEDLLALEESENSRPVALPAQGVAQAPAQLTLEARSQVDLEEAIVAREHGCTLEAQELGRPGRLEALEPGACQCGVDLEAHGLTPQGLDASVTDRGVYVDWSPCCERRREEVGVHGWAQVYGLELEDALAWELGLDVREVYLSDSLCRFSLSLREPGNGVAGWQTEVFEDVDEHHSHHDSPAGWKYGIAVYNGPTKVGVAVVGRPVARMIATREPETLEVTRVCCFGDARLRRNAASKLYGACAREAARRGYTKLITYTLESEDAASTKAANFVPVHKTEGGSWDRPSRRREDAAPTCPKVRWALGLDRNTRREVDSQRIELD